MSGKWEITEYHQDLEESLLDFLVRDPVEPVETMRRSVLSYLDWMYLLERDGVAKGPLILLVRNGEVHGIAGILKMELSINGRLEPLNLVRDFRISSKAKGYGLILARAVRNLKEMTCGLANERALKIWRAVACKDEFYEITPFEVFRLLPSTHVAGRIRAAGILASCMSGNIIRGRKRVAIEPIKSFEEDLNQEALKTATKGYPFFPWNTCERLQWRYKEQPGTQYTAFRITRDNKSCGFLVLHTYTETSGRSAAVDDILVPYEEPDLFVEAILFAVKFVGDEGASKLHMALTPFRLHRRIMRVCGFRPDPAFLPAPTFILHRKPAYGVHTKIGTRDLWSLTLSFT